MTGFARTFRQKMSLFGSKRSFMRSTKHQEKSDKQGFREKKILGYNTSLHRLLWKFLNGIKATQRQCNSSEKVNFL